MVTEGVDTKIDGLVRMLRGGSGGVHGDLCPDNVRLARATLIERALKSDRDWGTTTIRPRLVSWTERFAAAAAATGTFPRARFAAEGLHDRFRFLWPTEVIPAYPALAGPGRPLPECRGGGNQAPDPGSGLRRRPSSLAPRRSCQAAQGGKGPAGTLGTVLIQVISSTTREGRFSERTARWMVQSLQAREDFDVELIDLREYPLPFFDAPPPAKAPREYATAEVGRRDVPWTGRTGSSC